MNLPEALRFPSPMACGGAKTSGFPCGACVKLKRGKWILWPTGPSKKIKQVLQPVCPSLIHWSTGWSMNLFNCPSRRVQRVKTCPDVFGPFGERKKYTYPLRK